MIRKVVKYPSPILLAKATPVKEIDDNVRALLDDMAETMYAAGGVGLAAPQVGESIRAIVIDVSGGEQSEFEGLIKMVNPEIIEREGEAEYEEGCLSVPDMQVVMKRAGKVRARYLDENGDEEEIEAKGLLAIAIQHEIDHLDGKLIIDNVSRLKKDVYLAKRKKEDDHPIAL